MTHAATDGHPPAMANDVPEDPETEQVGPASDEKQSFFDEVGALVDDGRTYLDAELAFQKTRLSYVVAHAKWVAIFLGMAAFLVVLAVFALVFGIMIALMPMMTPIGATVAVVFALVLSAAVAGTIARSQLKKLIKAFESEADGEA